MTKIKNIILSVALSLLIIPSAIIFAACGCTSNNTPDVLVGDWKFESIIFIENGVEDIGNIGDPYEGGVILSDSFAELNVTEEKIELTIQGNTIEGASYTKDGDVYTSGNIENNDYVGKYVITLISNDKLKLEIYTYNSETKEFELEAPSFTFVRGKATK